MTFCILKLWLEKLIWLELYIHIVNQLFWSQYLNFSVVNCRLIRNLPLSEAVWGASIFVCMTSDCNCSAIIFFQLKNTQSGCTTKFRFTNILWRSHLYGRKMSRQFMIHSVSRNISQKIKIKEKLLWMQGHRYL